MGYSTRPPQNDWEAKRMGKFTASNIYRLLTDPRDKEKKKRGELGETAKTYIHQVASEIITGCIRSLDGYALDWGLQNEPHAAEKIGKVHEKFVYLGSENQLFLPYNSYSGGSPDGLCEETNSIYEIKCPENFENHIEYCLLSNGEELKAHKKDYYTQLQFNMMCYANVYGIKLEDTKGYFVSYCPVVLEGYKDFHIFEIKPDLEIQSKIIAKLEQSFTYAKELINKLKVNNNE